MSSDLPSAVIFLVFPKDAIHVLLTTFVYLVSYLSVLCQMLSRQMFCLHSPICALLFSFKFSICSKTSSQINKSLSCFTEGFVVLYLHLSALYPSIATVHSPHMLITKEHWGGRIIVTHLYWSKVVQSVTASVPMYVVNENSWYFGGEQPTSQVFLSYITIYNFVGSLSKEVRA